MDAIDEEVENPWMLEAPELTNEQVRYILGRIDDNEDENPKTSQLCRIIFDVFEFHIRKVRKPFEKLDDQKMSEACTHLYTYLDRKRAGRPCADPYNSEIVYDFIFEAYETMYEWHVEFERVEKEPENGIIEIGLCRKRARALYNAAWYNDTCLFSRFGIDTLYPLVFECAPDQPVYAPGPVVKHLCPQKWKWYHERHTRAELEEEQRALSGPLEQMAL